MSRGSNDSGRFGLAAAVVSGDGAPLSLALAAVRYFRWFVLAPRITAASALVLPFRLTALDHGFKADQAGPMAPGTFDCGGHGRTWIVCTAELAIKGIP